VSFFVKGSKNSRTKKTRKRRGGGPALPATKTEMKKVGLQQHDLDVAIQWEGL